MSCFRVKQCHVRLLHTTCLLSPSHFRCCCVVTKRRKRNRPSAVPILFQTWNRTKLTFWYSPFTRRRDSKWSLECKPNSPMLIPGLFSNGSLEKSYELWPLTISICVSTSMSSFIFSGTVCMFCLISLILNHLNRNRNRNRFVPVTFEFDQNVTKSVLQKNLPKHQSAWPRSQIHNCDILWPSQVSHIECDWYEPCFCFCLESGSERLLK